jgi:hypothetical protein
MAPKQPTHTTQTTKVELPEWVDQAARSNYQLAEQIAGRPFQEYGGETVAGMSDMQKQALGLLSQGVGAGSAATSRAADLFDRAGGGIAGMDRSQYMNPYIENVENKALDALDRQRIQSLMQGSDRARAAGAFGGSRHGIVEGVTNAEAAREAGILSSGLRADAFNQATGAMQQDISNMMGAGQGMLGVGSQQQQQMMQDFAALMQGGMMEQQQSQRELDDAHRRWSEEQGHDLENLNILLSSLGMSPYGKSEQTDKVTSGGGGTDFAQMGLGILQLLAGLPFFSDEDEKTDIKKLGKDPVTGIDLYAYRYKDDPKSYPKVVGPMAQDIEKLLPGAVSEIGGKKVVGMLAGA